MNRLFRLHLFIKIVKDLKRLKREERYLPLLKGSLNDYSFIEEKIKKVNRDRYSKRVSVIMPVYNRKLILDKTLAAMMHQTYPKNLFEVIVADDGSRDGVEELVEKYKPYFQIKIVSQEDRGYRLAAIRNKAVYASTSDVIISLDCDMLPVPDLVEAYMMWFHATEDRILVIGHRRFVNSDKLSPEQIRNDISLAINLKDVPAPDAVQHPNNPSSDWRLPVYKKTELLKMSNEPYRYASGGNVAYYRRDFLEIGGYDEEFKNWGGEDNEFAYRFYRNGTYLIPELQAVGLHQDHHSSVKREEDRKITAIIQKEKIPPFRLKDDNSRNIIQYKVPKVSIYIPAYNAEKYIKKTVESALKQTFKDIEVCICNDGSTDNTLGVLERHFKGDPRVRWVTINNSGIGTASNTAFKMCRGEYIGQLDSDDVFYPTAVEELVTFLDTYPEYGVVYSDCERIDENDNVIGPDYDFGKYSQEGILHGMIVRHFRMFRAMYWYRTEGFDTKLINAVDYDMFLKLSEVCRMYHMKKVLYQYRIHQKSTSQDKFQIQCENHVKVISKALCRRGLNWTITTPHEDKRKVVFIK